MNGGAFHQRFALPTYRVKNEDFGVDLTYQSGLAGARRLGPAPADYASVNHSTFAVAIRGTRWEAASVPSAAALSTTTPAAQPGRCIATGAPTFGQATPIPLTLTRSMAGATTTQTFSMGLLNTEAELGGYVDLPLVTGTTSSAPGLYRTRVVLRSQSNGSCVGPSGTFGVSDFAAAGTQTALEDGPLATLETRTLVNHRLTSSFGAGWAVGNVSRVYRDGDVAHLVSGSGGVERFAPRAHAKELLPFTGVGVVLARDPHTGEVFAARDNGAIQRVDVATGATSNVLSGLGFNVAVHGLAIAYVGGSREFIVALENRLLEIDAGGAQRVLTTRVNPGLFAQASVAAREDVVFYTDVVSPTLYRVRLSDPARTLEPLSAASGGDVRFFPQASLGGVSFADPRGLGFAVDGTLYVADRGRNTVYAVSPDATGNVVAASHVEPVVGDGAGSFIAPLGERQPGVRLSLREPLGLSMTEDGFLFVVTTYGIVSFDPLAREAEQLVTWGGIDELTLNPAALRVSVLGLTASSALSRADKVSQMVRFDIDRMSSQFDPTRTIRKLAGGALELTDTTRAAIETFDAAGRLVERKKRSGELEMAVSYLDASSDKIDRLSDAVGGATVFAYAGGKIQSITDARGRVTQLSVDGFGDLVSLTEPGNETHGFVYAGHRMTEKRSPRSDLTRYTYRADGTAETATKPEGAVTVIDAAFSHPSTFNAAGKIEHRGSYTDARGVLHDIVLNGLGVVETDTHIEDGVTRVDTVSYAPSLQDWPNSNGDTSIVQLDPASDRRNRLFRVSDRSVNGAQQGTWQRFDAHGRAIQEHRFANSASGDLHRRLFDPDGWLLEDYAGPSAVADRYERDAVGHVTRIYDRVPGTGSVVTGRERRWTYRADGLPLTMVEHGVTKTYA